jgi:hypothetical protein
MKRAFFLESQPLKCRSCCARGKCEPAAYYSVDSDCVHMRVCVCIFSQSGERRDRRRDREGKGDP